MDIDSAGAAYVFGRRNRPTFRLRPARSRPPCWPSRPGFCGQVDAQGKVVYATLIGGSADIYPSPGASVDAAGEAVVSDWDFVMKLDAGAANTRDHAGVGAGSRQTTRAVSTLPARRMGDPHDSGHPGRSNRRISLLYAAATGPRLSLPYSTSPS